MIILKILFGVICSVVSLAVLFCIIVILAGYIAELYIPKNLRNLKKNKGTLFAEGHSMIAAHRAGAGIAPENTPMAFDLCLNSTEFTVQELEFDLHMTKDEKLIVLHDGTLDRTTDAVEMFGRTEVKPSELTYDEIRKLNTGESFVTDSGDMPYKGLRGDDIPDGLRIPLLEEIIDMMEAKGEYLYSIDIKDSGEIGRKCADKLIKMINDKGIADRVIVATFNGDITKYLTEKYPNTQRSVGVTEGLKYYFMYLLNIRPKKPLPFKAIQVPSNQFKVVRPGTKRAIAYFHSLGVACQFWTIDDIDEIKRLSDAGADCIVTNVPDKMYNLFN